MTEGDTAGSDSRAGPTPEALALAIAWSPADPSRIGEVCIIPSARAGEAFVLGRGEARLTDPHPRLEFARNRAGVFELRAPISSPRISRVQLWIQARGAESLAVRNVGRCPLRHNGSRVDSASARPGDTLQLGAELLLLCLRRPAWVRSLDALSPPMPFGEADPYGVVGESPVAWELRRRIAFVAARADHVLITGESGTGKELAARAVHLLSPRAQQAFVARNAATLPEGLVDAELFGHVRNYPNMGMPERPGLVTLAAGGTLFFDEIAELPVNLQTHLLRVLDHGEYQRLGDGAARSSDFRLLAATNQPDKLRADLAARLKLTLRLPNLNERLEDVPLLVKHLLGVIARANPDIAARLFPDGDVEAAPRVALGFIDQLLRRHYTTNVRELEGLIWDALTNGPEVALDLPPRSIPAPPTLETPPAPRIPPKMVSAEIITATLLENNGSLELTWRALGLSSRHALSRLMTRYGVTRPK